MSCEELVDVVDENNSVLKTVTRKQMRQEQLPHRASYIAYMDRQGKFLVEIRTLCKDYSPGTFDAVVGGIMQHGEDPVESAKRELLEEVGVNADSDNIEFHPLGTLKISKDKHYLFAYLYLAKGDAITVRQQSEVSGVMFIEEKEIYRLADSCNFDSVTALKEIVKRAKEQNLL
ncbi:MAG: NUDIX domain-containing protein [Aeromonadales bacterium]|nr:NUDIX domain-containing protein [Aeromonadales bacterium]